MEKRKWLWKRRSSEKSPGETEISGSVSSHSEKYCDDQETSKPSPNHDAQSPEVASEATASGKEVNKGVTRLAEILSAAALSNVSVKEDLVQQHVRVAEEAIAGWEKAENEVEVLKRQLDAAAQQSLALEAHAGHLDGALKECVRQLRQAREEQEQRILEAVINKTQEWESTKQKLESQLLEIQNEAKAAKTGPPIEPDVYCRLEALEKENSSLKLELLSQSEVLEIRTIERDLSTEAAETASKQHLESIKKVAKVEAECRRLKAIGHRSFSVNDYKSTPASSSLFDESSSQSSSWASALIAELDQFKNEKAGSKSPASTSIKMDLMDDYLEMEQLASLPENKCGNHCLEQETAASHCHDGENLLKVELGTAVQINAELERKLANIEAEKDELELALLKSISHGEASEIRLKEAERKMEELEIRLKEAEIKLEESELSLKEAEIELEERGRELGFTNELKQSIEFELVGMKAEAKTTSMKVDSLEAEVDKERALAAEIAVKCRELESELLIKNEEAELRQSASSNGEKKVKQEELAVAAEKLAECQKTIASLGKQLESLATLEDFLLDPSNIREFSGGVGPLIPRVDHELSNPRTRDSDSSETTRDQTRDTPSNGNAMFSASALSSASSFARFDHQMSSENFGKLFLQSRNAIQDN